MLRPTLVTPATAAILVTLPEAKAHCRIDHTDDDALLSSLIAAAESYLDGYTGILGRAILEQTWEQKFSAFCSRMNLRIGLASSIVSVHYFDSANVDQVLDTTVYQLLTDELGPYVALKAGQVWPTSYTRVDGVTIQWKAGYGTTAATVPEAIRRAMLLMIGNLYENREAVVLGETAIELPMAATSLLAPFRRVGV